MFRFLIIFGNNKNCKRSFIINNNEYYLIFYFSADDKLLQAYYCFEEILRLNPQFLKSYQNLDNVNNKLVERWHFRMLNDVHRNVAYKNAVHRAVQKKGCKRVLDIGTGTGLLSIYAYQAEATEIVACDESKVMMCIAKQVIAANDMQARISLLNRYSCELNEGDIGGRVDLIVTEILDSGVFGEGILQTLIHAKENLLANSTDAQIIPSRIKLYIAGFESKTIAIENVCINNSFTDLVYLKGYRLVAATSEPYDTEDVRQIKDFKIITKIEEAFDCDFNNLNEMRQCLDGTRTKKVRLDYERSGFLDGFIVWFSLNVDDDNVIDSTPSMPSCWDQTIFKLNHRFANLEKLKYLNVTVSCKDGILHLGHYYDFPGKVFSVKPDIIKFINDTEYLNKLEFDFFANSRKEFLGVDADDSESRPPVASVNSGNVNVKNYENVLDFSPFPYIGISLLKEKRAVKLYCSKDSQDFIYFVATCNCLKYENIIFINEPTDVLNIREKFDIIILSPIETLGSINSSQISNYNILKSNKLAKNGYMIPYRLEMWGQIISSDWLSQVSRVNAEELNELHISPLLNKFSTIHQLNLLCFDHEKISNPVQFGDIRLDDEYAEKFILIKIKPSHKNINGILYFYKIYLTATAEPISTRRNTSFIKRACFVIDDVPCDRGKIIVHFQQNHGVLRCKSILR